MTNIEKLLLNVNNYHHRSWKDMFPDGKVLLKDLYIHRSWKDIIFNDITKPYIEYLEEELSECIEDEELVFPYYDLVFHALNITPLRKTKVVILSQDPYYDYESHHNIPIPQAMGLCFSVPHGINIPSSLKNIYANLLKYKHIHKMPTHGNLIFWAHQGCLMLNTSLTVKYGKQNKNCHAKYWRIFTDNVIKSISKNNKNMIFVLWGAHALKKLKLIDQNKHKVIISSHPSGLSCNKPLKNFSPFAKQDHFGIINKYLIKHKKQSIIWNI
uniref:Uracil-DNA glycosylase n=1 Tax=Mimivirus LCMiAC01 TaxID=2506608 RepID=A0A481Z1I9_9VIRU|nr:MAG: uracil-DNA glycosylase [Mimivirus LCMiAC01]